jgi:hypothetical protein
VVGGAGAVDTNSDDSSALAELTRRAEALRAKTPGKSFAQAFAEVYTDTANRDLVAAERGANRPAA